MRVWTKEVSLESVLDYFQKDFQATGDGKIEMITRLVDHVKGVVAFRLYISGLDEDVKSPPDTPESMDRLDEPGILSHMVNAALGRSPALEEIRGICVEQLKRETDAEIMKGVREYVCPGCIKSVRGIPVPNLNPGEESKKCSECGFVTVFKKGGQHE